MLVGCVLGRMLVREVFAHMAAGYNPNSLARLY
jgi:hypothetical protein